MTLGHGESQPLFILHVETANWLLFFIKSFIVEPSWIQAQPIYPTHR
jgi:hypothetical protein